MSKKEKKEKEEEDKEEKTVERPKHDNTDLKVQYYGPDQPQRQFWVAVCDVIIPDIYKFNLVARNVSLTHCKHHV